MTTFRPERGPDQHARHDQPLVAAYAAADLAADEAAAALELIASCRRCAALADEIALIQATVAADIGVPRRQRDFRLSEEDAQRLTAGPVTRLLRRLGGPGLKVLQPLAGAAMAIGLVLVVTTSALPGLGVGASAGGAPAPFRASASDDGLNSAQEGAGGRDTFVPAPAAAPTHGDATAYGPAPTVGAETDTSGQPKSALTVAETGLDPRLLAGLVLLVAGGVLLVLRLAARRFAEDPLLR